MPVDRSKCPRKTGNQLVWTTPVDTTTADFDRITFAPNVTPVSFDDGPPPLVDAPASEYMLFPPTNDCPSSRRPGHGKRKPENHIPRPPNAFILFRSSFIKSQHVSTEVETNHSTLSKIIGLTWKNLPDDEKQLWHAKAKRAVDEHKSKFPQYAFRPSQGRAKGGTEKRKVREVGIKDNKRCAKIAELLVEGKKGQELDAAIQEFDKHHVPEIITRFEAPITARAYRRRSSSVPIPDEDTKQPFLISTSPRKPRASSTQPTAPAFHVPPPTIVREAKQEALPDAFCDMSPFDQFSFPSYPPSFDAFTFSFDHSGSASPAFLSDQLSPPLSPLDPGNTLFQIADNNESSSQLSIDTAFLDHWTRCSSPMSTPDSSVPPTPSFAGSPALDAYGSFALESLELPLSKSFDGFPEFSPFAGNYDPRFPGAYADSSLGYPCFQQDHQSNNVHMGNLDIDFSAFMDPMSQYSP